MVPKFAVPLLIVFLTFHRCFCASGKAPKVVPFEGKSPRQLVDFVRRTILYSLDVEPLLGIGLWRNPATVFLDQQREDPQFQLEGAIFVFASINRLFDFLATERNWIQPLFNGGIVFTWVAELEREDPLKRVLSQWASTARAEGEGRSAQNTDAEDDEQQPIAFDPEEKRRLRQILMDFWVNKIYTRPFPDSTELPGFVRDVLFYAHLFGELLRILEHTLEKNNTPNPANVGAHIEASYAFQWLSWTRFYIGRWFGAIFASAEELRLNLCASKVEKNAQEEHELGDRELKSMAKLVAENGQEAMEKVAQTLVRDSVAFRLIKAALFRLARAHGNSNLRRLIGGGDAQREGRLKCWRRQKKLAESLLQLGRLAAKAGISTVGGAEQLQLVAQMAHRADREVHMLRSSCCF